MTTRIETAGEPEFTALVFAAIDPDTTFTEHTALMVQADRFLAENRASNIGSEVALTIALHAFVYGLTDSDNALQNLRASARALTMMIGLDKVHRRL